MGKQAPPIPSRWTYVAAETGRLEQAVMFYDQYAPEGNHLDCVVYCS